MYNLTTHQQLHTISNYLNTYNVNLESANNYTIILIEQTPKQ